MLAPFQRFSPRRTPPWQTLVRHAARSRPRVQAAERDQKSAEGAADGGGRARAARPRRLQEGKEGLQEGRQGGAQGAESRQGGRQGAGQGNCPRAESDDARCASRRKATKTVPAKKAETPAAKPAARKAVRKPVAAPAPARKAQRPRAVKPTAEPANGHHEERDAETFALSEADLR